MTGRLHGKIGALVALILLAEWLIGIDDTPGSVAGGFALAWIFALAVVRRGQVSRNAAIAAGAFAGILIDDPNLLAWILFWVALSLAVLLPRHRFDDAARWAARLALHGLTGLVAPFRDRALLARHRRRGGRAGRLRAVAAMLVMPVVGGTIFLALFAGANPLVDHALVAIVPPDFGTLVWRTLLAVVVALAVWPSLRPAARVTRDDAMTGIAVARIEPGVATLVLSLLTFNLIFAVQNALDVAFLWRGAALPAGVTMADYAHRGAYALIVAALLAGAFVLLALRPGSAGAASRIVRGLVTAWIAQTLLLVASSALRTLDYVDAYGMTVLRLSALAWMALVAAGLTLIAWRLLRVKSAAWLINANALTALVVLTGASIVDLGAVAASWNTRVALERGRAGPRLDLCYMHRLGGSALTSLAILEAHAANPTVRDRLAWLRWTAQSDLVATQAHWRSWTVRGARRLAQTPTTRPALRPAPQGRACDGMIIPLAPPPAGATPPAPSAAPPAARSR